MDVSEMKILAENFQKVAEAFRSYAENTSQQINRLIEMQTQAVGQQLVMSDVISLLLCFSRLLSQNLKQSDPEAFITIVDQLEAYAACQSETFRQNHGDLIDLLCCRESDNDLMSRIPEWIKQNPGQKN